MAQPAALKSLSHGHLKRITFALCAALLMSGCGFLIDVHFHKAQRLLASDLYTFTLTFLFSFVLLRYEARRRAMLFRRMEIVAEVNHHIRNALTGIVYTAAVRSDPVLQAVIEDATARVDWVLTTVLPDGSSDLQWPVQVPSWKPSPWVDPARPQGSAPDVGSKLEITEQHAAGRSHSREPDAIG